PSTSTLGSAARQIVQRGRGIRMPLSAVRSAQQIPQTNTGTAQTQHRPRWGIFTHGLARQSGLGTPLVANTPPVYVPPAALTTQQARALNVTLEIVGDPNEPNGFDASRERRRMQAVHILAQVLGLEVRHVNRHIPVVETPIRDIVCAVLIGAGQQIPGPRELARLIQTFIDAMNSHVAMQQFQVPNNQGYPGPNNGSGGASGGAAAGASNTQTGGAAAPQAANTPQFKAQKQKRPAPQPPVSMVPIVPVRPAPAAPAPLVPKRPAPLAPTTQQQPQVPVQQPVVRPKQRPQYPPPPIPQPQGPAQAVPLQPQPPRPPAPKLQAQVPATPPVSEKERAKALKLRLNPPKPQIIYPIILPPQPPLPSTFPKYLVFGDSNMLHAHDPTTGLPANSLLIKTETASSQPVLMVVLSSGFLREATAEDVKLHGCQGTWYLSHDRFMYTIIVTRRGRLHIS
ncbi:MAG: hypothetical protein ACRC9R_05390, partial [Enterovibrio sp.]